MTAVAAPQNPLEFATEMLATAQLALKTAILAKSTRFNNRSVETHEIKDLRAEVNYWQGQVAAETAKANGTNSGSGGYRRPFRYNL